LQVGGGDCPPEAIWGLNEMIDWLEKTYGGHYPRFDEYCENCNTVMSALFDSDEIRNKYYPREELNNV